MRLKWTWGAPCALMLAVAVAVSCQPAVPDFGPPGVCNPDAGLCPMTTSGGAGVGATTTTTTGVGGSGGVGPGTPVTGGVDLITEPDFIDSALVPYHAVATIAAYPATGGMTSTTFGSATGAGGGSGVGAMFTFPSLPAGSTWFFVNPQSTATALPTLSLASLPIPGTFTLPVVDPTTMQSAANGAAGLAGNGISAAASQIVVLIQNAGVPYQGVTVTGATGGAVVAYDTGDGVYSDQATATGIAGTVILFNSGLRGRQVLTFTDMNMMSSTVVVLAAQGAVTLATLTWP